jgi:hypothetical protein
MLGRLDVEGGPLPLSKKTEISGPRLLPDNRIGKKVFLEDNFWAELTEDAKFHEDAFRLIDANDSVSRNNVIDTYLHWAHAAYYRQIGGKPAADGSDRKEKLERMAALLKADREAAKKAAGGSSDDDE